MRRAPLEKILSVLVITVLIIQVILSPVPIATAKNAPITLPTAADSPQSMLNLAIEQLDGIDGLSASDRAIIGEAAGNILGIASTEFLDSCHVRSQKAFTDSASAIQRLQATKAYKDDASAGHQYIESAVTLVLQSDKELANVSINNASGALSLVADAATRQEMSADIGKAEKKYGQAQDQLLKGNDVPAIEAYKNAWSNAGMAIDLADGKTVPAVSITYPADGMCVGTPAVTLAGTVDDVAAYTISQVTVIVNGRETACTLDCGRFSMPVTLAEGRNTISVAARDWANNYGTTTVTVVLDTRVPVITVDNVVDGHYYNESVCPRVIVDEANLQTLSITLDDTRYEGAPIAAEGLHVLEARASDIAGNTASVALRFTVDLTPPLPYVSDISAGSYLSRIITINGGVTDANLDSMSLLINGVEVSGALPYDWNTALFPEGTNTVELRATDKALNTAAISIPVNVDNTLPTVRWLCPINGTMLGPGLLMFRWDGQDKSGISDYELFLGGRLIGRTTGTEYDAGSLADGSYNATVNVYDVAGNIGFNSSLFIVDMAPPAIVIDGVEEGGIYNHTLTPVINATDANLNAVAITLNGLPYGGEAIGDEGNYSLYVWADDLPGNRAEQRVNFSVDRTPPVLFVEELTANPTLVNSMYRMNITVGPDATVKVNNGTVLNEGCFNYTILLSAGVNEIAVTATDAAGNVAAWTKTRLIDDDPLPDYYETGVLGMDPCNGDSDSNMTAAVEADNLVPDSQEDLDGDLLSNMGEYLCGTNPLITDTDNDGLPDGFEFHKAWTEPLAIDTDGNTTADGDEDPDLDGLTNLQEYNLGTHPRVYDTDADGLSDYSEANIGTSPLSKDTDNDGLMDDSEVKLGSDPLAGDSDGDGVPDGLETYTTAAVNDELGVTVTITGVGDMSKQVTVANVTSEYFIDNEALVTPLFDIKVNGTYEAATVTLKYDPVRVIDPSNLTLCCWNETFGYYEPLDTVVDTVNHTITAQAPHFSLFGGFFAPLLNQMFNKVAQINRAATILFSNAVDTVRLTVRNTVNVIVKTLTNGQPTTRSYTVPTYQVTTTPTPVPTPVPTASPVPTPFPVYVPPPVPADAFLEPYAYVSNSNANIVSVINTYDNSIVASIPTYARPDEIAVSSDGNRVYVANDNRVSVIDARTNRVIYDIPFNYATGFLALSPDNTRLYVTNNGGISCVDLSNTQVIGSINNVPNIAGMDISRDGQYIFTSNYWDGTLEVSSTSSFVRIKTIRCAPDSAYQSWSYWNGNRYYSCGVATSVSTSHDGQHVYVSLWTSNDMGIINAQTLTRENTITLGRRSSDGVTVSPDDHVVYATNYDGGSISVVNADIQALAYRITVGTHPKHIDASHDGKYIFVCLEGGYVKSVNRLNGNAVSTIPIYGNSVRINPARTSAWPSFTDTDGDGLPDDVEKEFTDLYSKIPYHSDPTKPDTDYDGLTDKEEAGTSAICYVILNDVGYFNVVADPQRGDSDSDGLYDADELDFGTKPLNEDSDGDRLIDGREMKYSTDPLEANTDGDDYTDTFEIYNGLLGGYPITEHPDPQPVPLPPDYDSRIKYDILPGNFLGDPLVYEERSYSPEEMYYEFKLGAEYGDYRERVPDQLEHDNLFYLLGQTASSIAFYGDPRDVNAGWDHQDYISMCINGIGLVPAAGDSAKFAAKYISRQLVKGGEKTAFEAFSKGLKKTLLESGSREAELNALRSTVDDETLNVLRKSFSDEEIVDIVKNSDVNVLYLRMVMEDADVLKNSPKFAEYTRYVFTESGNAGLQKWLTKNIEGIGSMNAKMKRITAAGGTIPDALNARKLGYLNNLKGAHGEYLAYKVMLSKYGPVEGLVLKMPNKAGPDFIFKVTENGRTYVKIVEVKARKSLSMNDLKNYITCDAAGNPAKHNINYELLHNSENYFKNGDKGLPIDFELYLYGENSDTIAAQLSSILPQGTQLPYKFRSMFGETAGIEITGTCKTTITWVKET